MDLSANLSISTYGFGEASLYAFFKTQIDSGNDALSQEFKVIGNLDQVAIKTKELIIQNPGNSCSIIGDEDATYILVNGAPAKPNSAVVKIEGGASSSTITVVSGRFLAHGLKTIIESNFSLIGAKITWVYGSNGESTSIPVSADNLPVTEMYPNLPKNLYDYYDDYINSSSSILVLIGPPGTGKTSFLRGLLHHTSSSAMVSYDSTILEHDSIFANFISGHNKFMILEDSDTFLASRSRGNTVMHKFLNVGDGLVSTKGKKIIFTTNLPSVRDVDPALIRPGRCFDVVHFNKISVGQCQKIIDVLGLDVPVPQTDVTLAELFNPGSDRTVRQVGFN